MERRRKVLVLWHEGCTPATLQPVLTRIREEWAERQGEAEVMLEHVDRLKSAEYSVSTFDHALLGSIPPAVYVHDSDLLEEVSRILKPSAGISIREPVIREGSSIPSSSLRTLSQLTMSLRLAGLVEPLKVADENPLEETGLVDELNKFGIDSNNITIVTVQAKKPSYQLGASAPISLGRISTIPSQQAPLSRNAESAKIWTLAANDILDDDVDLMDSDTLLSEEDLMRPDPASLKSACGPSSGKRKACKNCSCGLADELLNDPSKPAVKRTVTSSCGNCYLGDAFRCASCPYLGMPAFKPGQEIKLSDRQLNADQ